METTPRSRVTNFLALEKNVVAVSSAMFLMGLGEELWRRFIPKYMEALGAPVTAIGLYGTTSDFLDGVYQYPGGWTADRFGRKTALRVFVAIAIVGYAVYLIAPSWPWLFAGLGLMMAWTAMASPTLFAVVGDALPKGRRAMGFSVQSILRRLPIVVAPALGGIAIAAYGLTRGVKIGMIASIAMGIATLIVVSRVKIELPQSQGKTNIRGVWSALPPALRKLLASDVFIRIADAMVDVFLVLYTTSVVGISAAQFGILIGVQMATAILVYIPAARFADRIGRKPFVIATFVAFSLFPIAVVLSTGFVSLILAYVVGGLREIGEPARKAMIMDLAVPHLRARSVGLYYLLRSVAITPAAFTGGLLWKVAPTLPFFVAGSIGLVGTILFVTTVSDDNYIEPQMTRDEHMMTQMRTAE